MEDFYKKLVMVENKEEVFGNTSSMAQIIAQMRDKSPIKLPEELIVKTTMNHGELQISIRHIHRAIMYMFEYASLSAKGTVTKRDNLLSRENRYLITGLTPGMKYQIRVGAGAINDLVRYGEVLEIVCE